ncbi:hypothetical protein TYRP_014235 [Tyrophagus putrescentiae]|nr:hypothetical protein TYRP_014235 [Tyrophagus putrescentiae]
MKTLNILSLLFLGLASCDPNCGDWESYKDEKCIKIIDSTHTFAEALSACQKLEKTSIPLTIHSPEEQNFMTELIFRKNGVHDTVWLGAHLGADKQFHWADEAEGKFTNWAPGEPSHKPVASCIQMMPEPLHVGKWSDEPCDKKNLVVCQRLQSWTLQHMQQVFLNSRKALKDAAEEQKHYLEGAIDAAKKAFQATIDAASKAHLAEISQLKTSLQAEINSLRSNPVPVNFTYVQLPGDRAPGEIWPGLKWVDVSASYAGLFFRVQGGEAAPFGKVQDDNAPHLSQVIHQVNPCAGETVTLAKGVLSGTVITSSGFGAGALKNCQKFLLSPGEVRPKNMATKVWRRTG